MEEESACPISQAVADPLGDHQVSCGGNGDRILRHDSIRDEFFSAAQSASSAPQREVLSLIPDSSSRPVDVYLLNWKRGLPAALDMAVISILQHLTLGGGGGAATTQGYALSVRVERKMITHAAACCKVGVAFHPSGRRVLGWLVQ